MNRSLISSILPLLGISAVSGFIGALLIFSLTRGVPFEAWASAAAAIATFLLAFFTYQSVKRTSDIISGEDRRHQQSLAPLITVTPYAQEKRDAVVFRTGYEIRSVGLGLALDIWLVVSGSLTYTLYNSIEDTPDNRAANPNYKPGLKYGQIQTPRYEIRPYSERFRLSALNPGGEYFQPDKELHLTYEKRDKADLSDATVTYKDMFGNTYETLYHGPLFVGFEWKQPVHLKLPSTGAQT